MVWDGFKAFDDGLKKLAVNTDLAVKEMVSTGASMIEAKAKANFDGVRHRKKSKTGKSWTYDPPQHVGGDKPNTISGYLKRSIVADKLTQVSVASYLTNVGPRAIYGRRIDFEYPYFSPAVESTVPQFPAMQTRVFKKYVHV